MAEGEDILYRPVLRGILDPRALDDGSVSLHQVMLLNEAMDVEEENKHRFFEHQRNNPPPPTRR